MKSHLKNLLAIVLMLISFSILRSEDYVPSGSILYNGSFDEDLSNYDFSGAWQKNMPIVNQNGEIILSRVPNSLTQNCSMLTPEIQLPELNKGWAKTLYFVFEEEFIENSTHSAAELYIYVDGKKILLDTRVKNLESKITSYDVTQFAGQSVRFGFEFNEKSDNSPTWKIKGIQLLSELELKGEITYTEARVNQDKKSLYVYLDVNVSGLCPKIDSFSEDNFEIFDNTTLVQPYMFYNPQEKNNITQADIVFLVDVSQSMSESLEMIKSRLNNLVDLLAGSYVDYKIGIVLFGDNTYTYNSRNLSSDWQYLNASINEIAPLIHGITDNSDSTSNVFGALAEASGITFRENSRKLCILLTNNKSYENSSEVTPPNFNRNNIKTILNKREIAVYPFFDFFEQEQKDQYSALATDLIYKGKASDLSNISDLLTKQIIGDLTNTYRIVIKSKNTENTNVPKKIQVKIHYNSLTK